MSDSTNLPNRNDTIDRSHLPPTIDRLLSWVMWDFSSVLRSMH
jgi:hypothetical protein